MRIVVTGSSSGMGRALAEQLLDRGHRVWGLARSGHGDLAGRYADAFGESRCDIAEWPQVEAAAAAVAAKWRGVDSLVCCAGAHGEIGPVVAADPARWAAGIRVNLDGTFHALRAFHPLLARAERRAKVVCFSGGGATKARPNFSAYAAAKTGVVRLIETAAEELAGQPIDLNAVAPGAINTRLTDEVLALGPAVVGEAEYRTAQKQKATGGGSLERAIGLVEWLLSPASDGISGRLLSAPWDPWERLQAGALAGTDVYTLRRITPEDRPQKP
ncbi:MAG TPA: SDR family oxidoreductase [Opitutaceae bacterium]|jgi:3-oxoacyl-[acyl-carrier protein] reductase|nr:SDR family oxidoreductase [Opitutaceae bacterium]